MAVSLEKAPSQASRHELQSESPASPEVATAIGVIDQTEQRIDDELGLTSGSPESIQETDAALVYMAEQELNTPTEDDNDTLEAALIAGALEASGQRLANEKNPIAVLELDGYSKQINDVIRELHESHATLPTGEQAAVVLAQEIDRVTLEHGLGGNIAVRQQGEAIVDIPEFDRLDDYSPEFPEQILMHRSNAELNEGDVLLPSDQISAELHDELNRRRGFKSSSSPSGSVEYDKKLAHAGTRDFGEAYGKYLYIVEPLEGDTLKWGENFGSDVVRTRKVESSALQPGSGELASTDSHTGKWHNEVVSSKGFRVVKKILHEPEYSEAMLPWPVSHDAVAKHKARAENRLSNVAPRASDTTPGYGQAFPITTKSRMRPGKIGAVNSPGTYRAGADTRTPAEWKTKFDVQKQNAENPGQPALPGMSIGQYGDSDRWKAIDMPPHEPPERLAEDTPLPGMEDFSPTSSRPMM